MTTPDKSEGEICFESRREDHGWYFVEYQPPQPGYWFAVVSVVVIESADPNQVTAAMEAEALSWLARYPIPVMVASFDDSDSLLDLETVRPSSHLMALPGGAGEPSLHWRILEEDEAPDATQERDLLRIYHDFAFTRSSPAERERAFLKWAKRVRTGKQLVTFWLVMWGAVIPACAAYLVWAGPKWLGVAVLIYSWLKAGRQGLKLLGLPKPSHREAAAQEKQNRMEHYYYHCEKNPGAFERLKVENFERDARAETQKEIQELRGKGPER